MKGISAWAEEDRPREKLILKGKATLSDAELLAILLGSGTAAMNAVELSRYILHSYDNNLNHLAKASVKDLQKIKGIGEAKALTIVSAMEIGRRRKETEPEKTPRIQSSQDAYNLIKAHLMDLSHEEFWIILLNRSNNLIKKICISSGGLAGTIADPKLIFKNALENLASSLILIHNHPSGNLSPSESDIRLTNQLVKAGALIEIPVLDHLIFTNHNYYSFADEGKI